MSPTEHSRLRLQALLAESKLTQAAFADRIGVSPDYISRLLYPPEKPGRKNLGIGTIRKISDAFDLPPGWFELPIGTGATGMRTSDSYGAPPPRQELQVCDLGAADKYRKRDAIAWPFSIVTRQRIERLQEHFGKRGMPTAISDIDKHLDVLVTRWENEMYKNKSSAA